MRGDHDKSPSARTGCWVAGVVSLFGLAATSTGCNVGPDFKKPQVGVPDQWLGGSDPHLATEKTAETEWWKSFDDATLDRLIELSYRQNLPLQVAGLRIAEARAQFSLATGRQFPQVQQVFANAAAVGLSNRVITLPGVDHHFITYELGFDAAWEMDFWGKYRRGVQAEASNLLATVADYYSALVSLTAEVARTYVAVRTFEVLIDLAVDNVRVQEQGLAIAESRFTNGATSELDPTQAKILLESTRASIPQLQIQLQQAQNALSTLLGQPPGAVESILSGPKQIPRPPTNVAVGVPAEMLRRRPDIRSAEFNAAAQCARIGVARAELYPSFSIAGSIGLQASTASGTNHNPFSVHALTYTVGPQITWPLLNYGRLQNAVRVEDARFQQLLVTYRDTVLKALQEVEDAVTGFLNSQTAVAFEEDAVASAKRSVELSFIMYREGAADFQRVLDAQRSLLEQQNELAQTSSNVTTSLIAMYKALGGGWEPRSDQPFLPAQTQKEMQERTGWGDLLTEPRSPEKNKQSEKK
ncbi:MAG TPA: efflux transporter outer membrane subunit [Polyangiaceae bacterium]|nr:efflux transporter outer membrane subunit [Polyangiaceae bacterium]